MAEKVIEGRGISKYFSGVAALKDVDFEVEKGEVMALMGENGAGKSTLSKIIAGIYQKDEGELLVHGEPCHFANTRQANAKGVAIVTQEFSLLRDLSVAENIFITNDRFYKKKFLSDMKAMAAETTNLLRLFNMENYIDPWEKVERLTVAQMQIVEIAKALSKNTDIIILDEPTASLSEREINLLFDVVRSLKKDGISFIIVSHKINEIYEISDRITVLRDGRLILNGAVTAQLDQSELIRAMVGREVSDLYGVADFTHKDFEGEEVILFCTLKGSILWIGDIMKNLTIKTKLDFISASSYGASKTSSGVVKIKFDPEINMYNSNIIVIEDIVDTGNTLKYVLSKLEERGPKCVKVCTMLNKESRRTADFHADYVGFEIDDLFVIGYGLDFDQRYRDLPYISYLEEDDVELL